jgi:hypothetical protein
MPGKPGTTDRAPAPAMRRWSALSLMSKTDTRHMLPAPVGAACGDLVRD